MSVISCVLSYLEGHLDHRFEKDREYLSQVKHFPAAPDGNSEEVEALFARPGGLTTVSQQ
ncbi:MAG: hypothetical protein E2P00_01840 [Acidobacteria bacterium]|nr:MAG: hypothetical protein E2P00_01840 [Acidobacteriota bacterium]